MFSIRMKLAVIGDVHGNFAALCAVLADIAKRLFYEWFDWKVTGSRWRELAREALAGI